MTGFPQKVLDAVQLRSNGACEICGLALIEQLHHRRPRAMGGSKAPDTNTASNCLGVCRACHSMVESRRGVAFERGWLVRQGQDPAAVPVMRWGCEVVLLDDLGYATPVEGKP